MPTHRKRWSIGLAGWVIQDGNYDDFRAGQRAEFAVEFCAPNVIEDADGHTPGAADVGDDQYEVVARVAHADDRGWVLAFGLMAYQDGAPPRGIGAGARVRTRLTLGIDPFFYFENLARIPEWPDLIYTWE